MNVKRKFFNADENTRTEFLLSVVRDYISTYINSYALSYEMEKKGFSAILKRIEHDISLKMDEIINFFLLNNFFEHIQYYITVTRIEYPKMYNVNYIIRCYKITCLMKIYHSAKNLFEEKFDIKTLDFKLGDDIFVVPRTLKIMKDVINENEYSDDDNSFENKRTIRIMK